MPLAIVHILRAPVGGLFRHVRDLARAQADAGHRVGVICDSNASDALTESRLAALAPALSLGLHRLAMSRELGPSDLTAYRGIRDLLAHLQADIAHGHGAKGGAYARLAGHALKRKASRLAAIYTPHGGSLHYAPTSPKGFVYMALERRLAPMTDAIVFESAYSRDRFADQVKAPVRLTRVIPNGLLPEEFEAPATDPDAADLLFVGELRRLKGVDVLLEALRLDPTGRPVRTVIVGDGPDRAEFERLATAFGLSSSVTFTGALPARDAFRRARVIVVPSRAESFPYIVLEAAAAGLPLIATRVGGIPEIVAGTDTLLVEPENASALAARIRDALLHPGTATARAARLKETVASRFTVAHMATGIESLYREALAR